MQQRVVVAMEATLVAMAQTQGIEIEYNPSDSQGDKHANAMKVQGDKHCLRAVFC